MRLFLLVCCCLVVLPAAEKEQLLGFGLTEGAVGFEATFKAAKHLGVDFVEIPVQWDEVEEQKEQYSNQFLDIANIYFPTQNTKLVLSINPVDTTALRMPKGLASLPFDDPRVIDRFLKLIDYVFSRCPDVEIAAIVVGNEVDAYLGNDPKAWAAYATLFKHAQHKLKKLYPAIPVGVKITSACLLKKQKFVQPILQLSDAVMATFYPLNDDFTVLTPEDAMKSLEALTNVMPDKPLCLLEAGYPSSAHCKSSEKQQALFMRLLIAYWRTYDMRMPLLNIVWMHDVSDQELIQMQKYYGIKSKAFASFIGSLGIRRHDGQVKPAYQQLSESLKLMKK